MLFKMPNVAVVSIDEFGDGGVQALAVGTLDEQYGGVFQIHSPDGKKSVSKIGTLTKVNVVGKLGSECSFYRDQRRAWYDIFSPHRNSRRFRALMSANQRRPIPVGYVVDHNRIGCDLEPRRSSEQRRNPPVENVRDAPVCLCWAAMWLFLFRVSNSGHRTPPGLSIA
jgi:hypothetical protein